MARNNLYNYSQDGSYGIYRPNGGSEIVGGLNRFASPWSQQGTCRNDLYPCYKVFVDDEGDGTAASRKRGRGLNPPDPLGYIPTNKRTRGRR